MDEHQFGAKIKARREDLGISQREVANALNIDQGKVSLIEKGLRRVDVVKELPKLAKLLKVSVSWFFENTDAPKEASPVEAFVKQHFPDVEFSDFEMRRMGQFLEPVLASMLENYVKTDPKLGKKVSGSKD